MKKKKVIIYGASLLMIYLLAIGLEMFLLKDTKDNKVVTYNKAEQKIRIIPLTCHKDITPKEFGGGYVEPIALKKFLDNYNKLAREQAGC